LAHTANAYGQTAIITICARLGISRVAPIAPSWAGAATSQAMQRLMLDDPCQHAIVIVAALVYRQYIVRPWFATVDRFLVCLAATLYLSGAL
jgi:hypothetical protein